VSVAPIRRSISVKTAPPRAFELFVRDIGRWWPPAMHIGASPFITVVIEPHTGGRWYQRAEDGAETQWGEVLEWGPPARLLLAWRIGPSFTYDPDLLTRVELTFVPQHGSTLVTLEHRDLDQFGASAERMAQMLSGGWARPLQGFADFIDSFEHPQGGHSDG
jgi:uncharacterized protein YndB with AHSA1/START domain